MQLQVVCFRLWEKLDAGTTVITDAQVTSTGNVDSALADYYAERVRQIAEQTRVKERVIREWFDRRLITESGIRGQVMHGSDSNDGLTDEAIRLLEDVHLVRGEERRGVTWLELAHDRLIQPIRADNAIWSEKNLSILQHQATVWNRQNRSDSLCLRAEALAEAQEWAEAHTDELTETEREFLDVCQRNHDARAGRRLRLAVTALVIVLSCISILAGVAVWQSRRANRERHVATARSIAAQAHQLMDDRLDVALILATEAQRMSDLPDTRGALLTAAYFNPRLITSLQDPGMTTRSTSPINTLAFSADGLMLATGGFNSRVVLWKMGKGERGDDFLPATELGAQRRREVFDGLVGDTVRAIAFSADGIHMAVCSKDGSVKMWDRSQPMRADNALVLQPAADQTGAIFNPTNVWCLAFSPDSTMLASGDWKGRVLVWDVARRAQIGSPLLPDGVRESRALAFHPGVWPFVPEDISSVRSLRARIEGQEGMIAKRLWNSWEPPTQRSLTDPKATPEELDARWIEALNRSLTGDSIYDEKAFQGVMLSEETRSLLSHTPPAGLTSRLNRRLLKVAFPAEFRQMPEPAVVLIAGCNDGSIVFWRREGDAWRQVERRPVETQKGAGVVTSLAVCPSGGLLAVGRNNNTVALYTLTDFGAKTRDFKPYIGRHEGTVSDVAFSPDGSRLITSSFDGTVRLWEVPEMSLTEPAASALPGDALNPWRGFPRLTRIGPPYTGHVGRVFTVAFSPDGRTAASGGTDRKTLLWDTWRHVSQPIRVETGSTSFRMAFSPDGRYEANSYADGSVTLQRRDVARWIVESEANLAPASATSTAAPLIAFSADNRFLVSTMGTDKVRVHEMAAVASGSEAEAALVGEFTPDLSGARTGITTVAVSRDRRFVAAATKASDRKAHILVWNLATRALLFGKQFESPSDEQVFALEFSPDGNRLAAGGDAEYAVIWNLTGTTPQNPVRCPEEHTGKIRSIAFTPDGQTIATAAGDNTLILWNAQTGHQLAPPLTGHQAPVVAAAFSPDGKLLASGGDDTLVILWDLVSRQPIGRLTGHTDTVRALAFTTDSKRLFSGSWDAETRQWHFDPATLQDICRERANRNLTEREWPAYFGREQYHKTWPELPDNDNGHSLTPSSPK